MFNKGTLITLIAVVIFFGLSARLRANQREARIQALPDISTPVYKGEHQRPPKLSAETLEKLQPKARGQFDNSYQNRRYP